MGFQSIEQNKIVEQFTRMNKVLNRIGDENLQTCHIQKMSFHRVGLHVQNGTATVDQLSDFEGMKGFFSPYGVPFNPCTSKNLFDTIISIAHIVQFLHKLGIAHNDIRWSNVCSSFHQTGNP